ncbi:MAG: C-GCAxxG-C-C family protein [Candidatus Aureabacteria bacterium]|nr:C-GCAxxG-C-C family protein [Candidatus Auribacterota bacterium]
MEIALAKRLFHGREKYNCAQAILKAFQEYNKLTDSEIAQHQSSGGGRAEGGVCGALYAAKLHLDDAGQKTALEKSFKDKAKYITCKEIKKNQTLSCIQCIETAAALLKEKIEKSNKTTARAGKAGPVRR